MSQITPQTLRFLKDLKKNNNRPWFQKNKDRYTDWHTNGKAFLSALRDEMTKIDRIEKSKVYRIYKDVRFSKDKTPYKTHMAISLAREKPYLRGGYYLHIEPEESFVACGFWGPNPHDLALIRSNIDIDPQAMRKAITASSIKNLFGELQGQTVKTAPKGYPRDHPDIDLLRHKQFYFTRRFDTDTVLSDGFLKEVVKSFKGIRPFFDYMSDILTHNLNGEPLY